MKSLSIYGEQLYTRMLALGYPEEFSRLIAAELNTEFTCKRMMGYLSYQKLLPLEVIADEMLSIIEERNAIKRKKEMEYNQSVINEVIRYGFDEE